MAMAAEVTALEAGAANGLRCCRTPRPRCRTPLPDPCSLYGPGLSLPPSLPTLSNFDARRLQRASLRECEPRERDGFQGAAEASGHVQGSAPCDL